MSRRDSVQHHPVQADLPLKKVLLLEHADLSVPPVPSESRVLGTDGKTETAMSSHPDSETRIIEIAGRALEVAYHYHPGAVSSILLLHEALGSVSYWRRFPEQLSLATKRNVVLYSRAGHGNSPGPLMPRTEQSYLDEVNTIIPALLKHFHIDRSVVYGHSEGAAIAILYASTSQNADALILESPFLVAHAAAAELVSRMQTGYPGSELQQRLSKYHLNADAVFQCWASAAGNLADGQVAFA